MIAITTSNSIKVNPGRVTDFCGEIFGMKEGSVRKGEMVGIPKLKHSLIGRNY